MQFTDNEAVGVKKWVVKKLEDISDADSDVLADYVLALVRSDAPADEIKRNSVENLEDFLREHTQPFVNELFNKFGPKQAPPAPKPKPQAQTQKQPNPVASTPTSQPPVNAPSGPKAATTPGSGRKRTFNDGFQGEQEQDNGAYQNRAMKTPRRGRGGGRGDFMGGQGGHQMYQMNQGQQYPQQQQKYPQQQYPQQQQGFPMMPGFPQFDPNDPMAAMMAMQGMPGMGFPQMQGMPGMPGMPGAPGQPGADQIPKSNQRCPFYDTQGICYLGDTCPYQHGELGGPNGDEYDPKTAGMNARGGAFVRGDRGRGRGRGGFSGRGRGRSDFSSAGPNEDQSVTTIVVEQIPDDKFNEEAVRQFFSEFGTIADVSLQPYKKLALVKYETFPEAKAAWASPKVIFDNRFVKVYWYKPEEEQASTLRPEAPAFNPEEFQKQQEEAQKAHEEKLKKRQETEAAKQALERQRDELLKKQQDERARLMQRLGGTDASTVTGDAMATEPADDENASEQTKQLRAQLAALEAEAKSMGLDPESDPSRGGYRGRGGSRGRGTFRGRGAYDPNFRGGFRGRGGLGARGRGGVLRLDNRPRRVAVSGVELNSDKDEALRQHLMGVGEYESIEAHPDQPNSVVVAFKERFQAEKLMFSPWNIPSVGDVQLTWVANPPISIPASTATPAEFKTDEPEDTVMEAPPAPVVNAAPARDMDYDVAEDDNWGAQ